MKMHASIHALRLFLHANLHARVCRVKVWMYTLGPRTGSSPAEISCATSTVYREQLLPRHVDAAAATFRARGAKHLPYSRDALALVCV